MGGNPCLINFSIKFLFSLMFYCLFVFVLIKSVHEILGKEEKKLSNNFFLIIDANGCTFLINNVVFP